MPKLRHPSLLGLFVVAGVVVLILFIFFPSLPDPKCEALLMRPESDVAIPLPDNCMLTADAAADQIVKYLENERKQRGLVFKAWIHCNPSSRTQTTDFAFTHDPRWLPSYVPGAYQFRQTVILYRYAPPTPQASAVAGEVCLMPRRRYVSQIAGQCDGKFSVWK